MKRLAMTLGFTLLMSAPGMLQGQQRARLHAAFDVSSNEASREAPGAATRRETAVVAEKVGDYRYEGLVIGAALFGTVGVLAGQLCGPQPVELGSGCGDIGNSIALGLAGAALGGGLGFLIGMTAPKYGASPGDSAEAR